MRWLFTAAFLAVACNVWAEPVDSHAANGVAARYVNDSNLYVLCTDGLAYVIGGSFSTSNWTLIEDHFPIAVEHMADWTPYFILSDTGETWKGTPNIHDDDWAVAPALPCASPVPSQGQSLGGVKGLFR